MLTQQTTIQRHNYSFVHRVVNWFFVFVGISTILLIMFGGFSITLSSLRLSSTVGSEWPSHLLLDFCLIILFVGIPLLSVIAITLVTLTINPSITVSEKGIQVRSLIGESSWLSWAAIKKARSSFMPSQQFWMIGVEGLGWPYKLNGLLFWLGTGGFQVTQSIEDYHGLMEVLRKRRPDLFS
jgi:hypothetical protein